MGIIIVLIRKCIVCAVCIAGAIVLTKYYKQEVGKLKDEFANGESTNHQSQKIEIDIKATRAVFILGLIALFLMCVTNVIF